MSIHKMYVLGLNRLTLTGKKVSHVSFVWLTDVAF